MDNIIDFAWMLAPKSSRIAIIKGEIALHGAEIAVGIGEGDYEYFYSIPLVADMAYHRTYATGSLYWNEYVKIGDYAIRAPYQNDQCDRNTANDNSL